MKNVIVKPIKGSENPADLGTSSLESERTKQIVPISPGRGGAFGGGRDCSLPDLYAARFWVLDFLGSLLSVVCVSVGANMFLRSVADFQSEFSMSPMNDFPVRDVPSLFVCMFGFEPFPEPCCYGNILGQTGGGVVAGHWPFCLSAHPSHPKL